MLAGQECVQYRPDSTKFNWMTAEIERNGSPLVWSLLDTDPLPIDVFLALNHQPCGYIGMPFRTITPCDHAIEASAC